VLQTDPSGTSSTTFDGEANRRCACGQKRKQTDDDDDDDDAPAAPPPPTVPRLLPPPLGLAEPVSGAPPLTVAELDEFVRRRSECDPSPRVSVKETGPLSEDEKKLTGQLVGRLFAHSPTAVATVHNPAGHHPLAVAHIPLPKIGSADAGPSTLRNRSALSETVLTTLAVPKGESAEDAARHMAAQRASVVKREEKEYRSAVEDASGVPAADRFGVEDIAELMKLTG
jgi:hypothetical protein